jgi:hypothetical protein
MDVGGALFESTPKDLIHKADDGCLLVGIVVEDQGFLADHQVIEVFFGTGLQEGGESLGTYAGEFLQAVGDRPGESAGV